MVDSRYKRPGQRREELTSSPYPGGWAQGDPQGPRPAQADCWDNAVSETLFATLEKELLEKELLALQPLQSRG